jgi:O-antigen ligase
MQLLLFITNQFTYKRFLFFWAATGLFFTHSWLTEPTTSEAWNRFAKAGYIGCGLIAVLCFGFSFIINKSNFRFKISGYSIGMILYLLSAVISGVVNNSAYIAVEIVRIAIPIGFGLSFIYVLSEKDLRPVLFGFALYGLFNVIVVYAVFIANYFGIETVFSLSGFFTDRNGFSRYLSIVHVFFCIEFLSQNNKGRRVIYLAFIAIIFVAILIQNSRSGYIVYFISSTIIIFASGSKSVKKVAFFLLPIMLALFVYFTMNRLHSEKMLIVDYSDIGRIYVLKSGINMIKAHPIKGIGFRMSDRNLRQFADISLPGLYYMKTIHNWFVTVWAENGIFGLLVFFFLNFSIMHKSFKHFSHAGFTEGKYSLFAFTALVILMLDALVLPAYDYESIYWIILAIGAISLINTKQLSSSIRVPNKYA